MNRFVLVTLVITVTVSAQQQAQDKHFVRASAEATVTGMPDCAQISIGVQTQAGTAKAAAEENAAQTAEVIKTIKAILGSSSQIQTVNYSISPHYEMNNGGSRQDGFETHNSVEVRVDDLSLLPQLLDASSARGANNIGGISFSMKDDSALRLQALAEATRKARTSAEAIAQALNLHVAGVVSAESGFNSTPIRPMSMMMALPKTLPSTPIESGSVEISASVTVTLEVNP